MDFTTEQIKPIYFKYLSATFGSAMISAVYSIVDMAIVGQYHGPVGTAALAVVAPVWNVIYSLGLLMGIGGSVIFSAKRGQASSHSENEYFTAAVIGALLLAFLSWMLVLLFEDPIFTFFGADQSLLPLVRQYMAPIKRVLPLFLFNQVLAAFLRNDNHPALATIGVLAGGIFNIFGDYFFVFSLDMGIHGAGLATAISSGITLSVLMTHFFTKKNSLSIVRTAHLWSKLGKIMITGFSTFFIDIAMGILTVLFNRQIMKYLGANALSIYGLIVNISTLVQCCAYSVGQAAQPLFSVNYGAGRGDRIREILKYALFTVAAISIFWTALSLACPNLYVRIFMKPTRDILDSAPAIIRSYALSFFFLPLNIFSTYYFQSLLKPRTAFVVSVSRGLVISGALILLLPAAAGAGSLWFAMPITELLVSVYVIYMIAGSRLQ